MATDMVLYESLRSFAGRIMPPIYVGSGAGAMDHRITPGRAMLLDMIFMTVAAGAAVEPFVVLMYDGNDVETGQVGTLNMGGDNSWVWTMTRPIAMGSDWYLSFTWLNTNTKAWRMHVSMQMPT